MSPKGVVSRPIRLECGAIMRFLGVPKRDGKHVRIRAPLRGSHPETVAAWTDCEEATLRVEHEAHALGAVRIEKRGFGSVAMLTAKLPAATLSSWVEQGADATLDVCGWEISLARQQEAAGEVLKAFKRLAMRFDTWEEPESDEEAEQGTLPDAEQAPQPPDADAPDGTDSED